MICWDNDDDLEGDAFDASLHGNDYNPFSLDVMTHYSRITIGSVANLRNMKPLLSLLSILLLFSFALSSQTTLTIKSQLGRSWQNYGDDFPLNGYEQNITHYGFSAEVFRAINHRLAIGVAPGFMRRGAACEPSFIAGDRLFPTGVLTDATIYLDYLQLPFLIRADFPIWGKLEATAQTGAGFAYLLSGFREITFLNVSVPDERRDLDFSGADNNLNRFDFGWSSSVGFAYGIGRGEVRVAGEYYNSFLDMNQNNTSLNRNWAVSLAYQFNLSKAK
ncbi:MAG: hypothetical protein AAFO03_22510 [Bacteroidota bacterium]